MPNVFIDRQLPVGSNFTYDFLTDNNIQLWVHDNKDNHEQSRIVIKTLRSEKTVQMDFGYKAIDGKYYHREINLSVDQVMALKSFFSDYIDSFFLLQKNK